MSAAAQGQSHVRPVGDDERRPACDLLAEQIVACNVIENAIGATSARILEVLDIVTPADFFSRDFRLMYQAAIAVHERGELVTPNAVFATLVPDRGPNESRAPFEDMERSNARERFFGYLQSAPEERNIRERALVVREFARRRQAEQKAGNLARLLRDREEAPTEELIEKAIAELQSLGNDVRPPEAASRAKVAQAAAARATMIGPSRISTGLPGLDQIQRGGLPIGEVTLLGARRGTGKSALAGFIAHRAAASGIPTFVGSLENDPEDFVARMACERAAIPANMLRDADGKGLEGELLSRYLTALEEIAQLPLLIAGGIDTPKCRTVPSIREELRRAVGEIGRTRLLVLDYLQEMHVDYASREHSSTQLYNHEKALVQLAKQCGVAVVAVIQLKADGVPKMCSQLEDGAQNVWHLKRVAKSKPSAWARPEPAEIELLDVWVEKARFAPQHVETRIRFDKQILRFEDDG